MIRRPSAYFFIAALLVSAAPLAAQTVDAGLMESLRGFEAAMKAADPEKVANYYADDAVNFDNGGTRAGRSAILSTLQRSLPRRPFDTITWTVVDANSSGDLGYTFETFAFADDGQRKGRTGHVLIVWRRINNQWRVSHITFHNDPPASAAAR